MHRHQSDIVRVQANNPIGWGAMAVVVQNCLVIYMIGPLMVRTTPNSEWSSRIAGNQSTYRCYLHRNMVYVPRRDLVEM